MKTEGSRVNIIQRYIPVGKRNRPGKKITPKYITVHETDNTRAGADAENHAEYLANNEKAEQRPVSWHFTVDDTKIIQHLPTNEMGYHAGSSAGNQQSIGVEICVNSDGDFEQAVQNAAWLVKKLMNDHNIPISRVVPHRHWTGKNCPRNLLPRWQEFIAAVQGKGVSQVTQPLIWTGQPLKRGDRGTAVWDLQQQLKRAGFDPGPIDGVFGAKTEAAVKAAQKAYGLVVDGIAGPKTYQALQARPAAPKQQTSDGKKYRVLTGTFPSREAAEQAAKRIKETFGYLTYIVDA